MSKALVQLLLIASGLIIATSALSFWPLSQSGSSNSAAPSFSWDYSETQLQWCSPPKNLSIKTIRKVPSASPQKSFLAILTQDNTVLFTSEIDVLSQTGTSECLNYTVVGALSTDKDLVCYDLEVFQSARLYDVVADCYQTRIDMNMIHRLHIQYRYNSTKFTAHVTIVPCPNYYPLRTFSNASKRYLRASGNSGDTVSFYRFVKANSLPNSKRWHIEKFSLDVQTSDTTAVNQIYHLDSNNMPIEDFILAEFYPFEDYWILFNQTNTILTAVADKGTLKIIDNVTFANSSFENMRVSSDSDKHVSLLVSYIGATAFLKINLAGIFEKKLYSESGNYTVLDSWLGDTIFIQLVKDLTTSECSVNVGNINKDEGPVAGLMKQVTCPTGYMSYLPGVQFQILQTNIIMTQNEDISIIKIKASETALGELFAYDEFLDVIESQDPSISNIAIAGDRNQTSNTTNKAEQPLNQTNSDSGEGFNIDTFTKEYRWLFIAVLAAIVVILVLGGVMFAKCIRRKEEEEIPEYAAVAGMDALA